MAAGCGRSNSSAGTGPSPGGRSANWAGSGSPNRPVQQTGQHVRVTGTAQREAWLARTAPPVEQVRPDLWSVPVPIPDSPLRYTLTYLIAAEGGLVVVDPGWDTDAGWNALAEGLKAAGAS